MAYHVGAGSREDSTRVEAANGYDWYKRALLGRLRCSVGIHGDGGLVTGWINLDKAILAALLDANVLTAKELRSIICQHIHDCGREIYHEQWHLIQWSGPDHVSCPPCLAWFLRYTPDGRGTMKGFRANAQTSVARCFQHGEKLREFMALANQEFFLRVLRQILPPRALEVPVLTDEAEPATVHHGCGGDCGG